MQRQHACGPQPISGKGSQVGRVLSCFKNNGELKAPNPGLIPTVTNNDLPGVGRYLQTGPGHALPCGYLSQPRRRKYQNGATALPTISNRANGYPKSQFNSGRILKFMP